MNQEKLRSLAGALLDSLYPHKCPLCGDITEDKTFCKTCTAALNVVRKPICEKCGKQVFSVSDKLCGDCKHKTRSFIMNRSALNYDNDLQEVMAQIKYHNKKEYIYAIAGAVRDNCGEYIREVAPEYLVPVPVHEDRLKERGYNQALVLAEELGRRCSIPVAADMLVRTKHTKKQKELSADERLKNLEKAFAAGRIPEGVSKVMLVDDIYTTGSTLEACTQVLKAAGVKEVYGLCACSGGER